MLLANPRNGAAWRSSDPRLSSNINELLLKLSPRRTGILHNVRVLKPHHVLNLSFLLSILLKLALFTWLKTVPPVLPS
jgi:hypothetical protein